MADTWVKIAVPDYRRLQEVSRQVLGNTASHPCLRSSADSASFPDTICWRTLPDATDPTTKINVYNGVLFSKSKGWGTLPAAALEAFVEDTNFTTVTLPEVGTDETCVYLVWACKLTADTGDAEAAAEYPGELSIVADSAALAALQDHCDYHAVIALIFWDSTNDCGYRIAQRISSPLFLDASTPGDTDSDTSTPEKPLGEQKSIETKNGWLQIYGFDAETIGPGLLTLLKVDHPEGGDPELTSAGESDNIFLLGQRVNGDIRSVVRIPLSLEEANDPDSPGNEECDQNTHPASGGGGTDEEEDHPADEDEEHPGEGEHGTDGDTGDSQHPAADDCYTTAY